MDFNSLQKPDNTSLPIGLTSGRGIFQANQSKFQFRPNVDSFKLINVDGRLHLGLARV